MPAPVPAPSLQQPIRLLALLLTIMVVLGFVLSKLTLPWFTAVFCISLILANTLALILLVRRSREPGPEQLGWRLFAISAGVIVASNFALFLAPLPSRGLAPAEGIYLGLQVLAGALQAWGLLAWPFRSSAEIYRHPLNVLGGLVFALAIFMLCWGTLLQNPIHDQVVTFQRLVVLSLRVALAAGIAVHFLAERPARLKGLLGWFLLGILVWGGNLILAQTQLTGTGPAIRPSPLFVLTFAAPFTLIIMASSRKPLDPPEEEERFAFQFIEWLIALPFLAVGALQAVLIARGRPGPLAITLGFLLLCTLFLVRHFLLLREARLTKEALEERVQARTEDLESAQTALIRTERMNSMATMGAGLAHDLNNALTIVRSGAQISQMKLQEGVTLTAADLERIVVAADQSSALTQRLMAFARQEEAPPGLIDLHQEAEDLEPLLRMLLPRNITLKLAFRDPITPILGSKDRIEQMLVNLVSNARDAMPRGGRILVELDRDGDSPEARIFLRVTDNGPGIPQELQERIFEPFFTTKPPGKGTGLGLPSVRHTIEEIGGCLEVQSELGKGTAFTLWFPPPLVQES